MRFYVDMSQGKQIDLYAIMGISKTATAADIKKAYHRESLVKHPDRGGSKEAFQELQMAHEILRDPAKRAEYDVTGRLPGSESGGGGGGGGGPVDLSEIFGSFFGGGGGGGGGGFPFFGMGGMGGAGAPTANRKAPRGPNKIHEIGVSMTDLYHGKKVTLNMKREVLCSACDGKGGSVMEQCTGCRGNGIRVRAQQMGPMMTMSHEPCSLCNQRGQTIKESCKSCKGRGVTEREAVLDVSIEPGMQEGDRLLFPGQCSESPMYETPGDVILIIRAATSDPEEWIRRGADLIIDLELTFAESLLGWGRHITTHPSSSPLHIRWDGRPLQEGDVLTIAGKGMPVRGTNRYGDLRIVCRIKKYQDTFTAEQRRILKEIWPEWIGPTNLDDIEYIMPQASAA